MPAGERPALPPRGPVGATAGPQQATRSPGRFTDVAHLVRATECAAAFVDSSWRVLAWNREAEKLFGYSFPVARGRPVHDVLRPLDVFGNPVACFCGPVEALRRGERTRPFVIDASTAAGEQVRVVVEIADTEVESRGILCRFRPDARRRRVDRRSPAPDVVFRQDGLFEAPGRMSTPRLTPAELNVLRLLATGMRADEVAATLFNSVLTVRNHIQRIFRKLGARNQAQAVSYAIRSGLV